MSSSETSLMLVMIIMLIIGALLFVYKTAGGAGTGAGAGGEGAGTSRPWGGGAQPGSVWYQPGSTHVPPPGWLAIFLNTFQIAFDQFQDYLDRTLQEEERAREEEERLRRLGEEPERRARGLAETEDERLRRNIKDPRSAEEVDRQRNSKVNDATGEHDRSNKPPKVNDTPDGERPVDRVEERFTGDKAGEHDGRLRQSQSDQLARDSANVPEKVTRDVVSVDDDARMRDLKSKYAPPDPKRVSRAVDNHVDTRADAETSARTVTAPKDASPRMEALEDERFNAAHTKIHTDAKVPKNTDAFGFLENEKWNRINDLAKRIETRIQTARTRGKGLNKRVSTARTVAAEIVEPRDIDPDTGKPKRVEDTPPDHIRYDMKKGGLFGHAPSAALTKTAGGKANLTAQLSAIENANAAKSTKSLVKGAALKVANALVVSLEGIGFVLDVLQIVQTVGNSVFYDPNCGPGGDYSKCKFPEDLLSSSQVRDVVKLSLAKQIDAIKTFTETDPNFKPFFPIIYGPMDTLNPDPYENQALIEVELDSIQNKIFNAAPYLDRFVAYLGADGVQSVLNDPTDALSYYAGDAGLTNTEIDTVYGQAFTKVCTYNGGKVWQDTYSSGRIRYQCGYTQADCETNRLKYFTPTGTGSYAEWYTNAELPAILPTGIPVPTFTNKPSDQAGMCLVTNAGIAGLCQAYNGTYVPEQHTCTFTPAYCQSIGTCHNSTDNTCYIPSTEMEALSFFYGDGGVREWIKRNGCTFVGTDAQKAQYAFQSSAAVFCPVTLLFTAGGRAMFADAIKNFRNWGPGLESALSDPNVAIGVVGASVGIAMTLMTVAGVTVEFGPPGWVVAAALIIAAAISIAVTMTEAELEKEDTPQADNQESAIMGLVVNTTSDGKRDFRAINLGFANGWVTRKLPLTVDQNGQKCSAYQHYSSPTTCTEVSRMVHYPGVTEIPWARTDQNGNYDYKNRLQCWKYEKNTSTTQRVGSNKSITESRSYNLPFPITGLTEGDAYGYTDGANIVTGGNIRVGSYGIGESKKIWCMNRMPDTSLFDSQIGTPATTSTYTMNRVFTSRYGDSDQFYPAYPSTAWKNPADSASWPNPFRYQLVYDKDSIKRDVLWNTPLMTSIFTDTTVSEIRKYYCEKDFITYAHDLTQMDKRCFGYMNLSIPGMSWYPMSVPGVYNTGFGTNTGTLTIGPLSEGNAENLCAQSYGQGWEEDSRDLCYLNCNYGGGAQTDGYKYVSTTWDSDGALWCYKQYPTWEHNNQLHYDVTITKNIVMAEYQGAPNDCPSGYTKDGGFCYKSCAGEFPSYDPTNEYYEVNAHVCYKHHKTWQDYAKSGKTLSSMTKPVITARYRGPKIGAAGVGECASGEEWGSGGRSSGLCYPTCPAGQTGIGPVCWYNSCPDDMKQTTAGLCIYKCGRDMPDGSVEPESNFDFDGATTCYRTCDAATEFRSAVGWCMKNCQDMYASNGKRVGTTKSNGAGVCYAYTNIDCNQVDNGIGDYKYVTTLGGFTPTCYRNTKTIAKPSSTYTDSCATKTSWCYCHGGDSWGIYCTNACGKCSSYAC